MVKRLPCRSCPWRKSTPEGGFPGGKLDVHRLISMAKRDAVQAMQCHATPDGGSSKVCVGFALVVGFDCIGLRLAAMTGRYDPEGVDTDEELHTFDSLILTHGTLEPEGCKTLCEGCRPGCKNLNQEIYP